MDVECRTINEVIWRDDFDAKRAIRKLFDSLDSTLNIFEEMGFSLEICDEQKSRN